MWQLVLTSIMLGVGLAMDACAVSMTNGLNEPKMKRGKAVLIAFVFAFFQALMPMIGWLCVVFIADKFAKFASWIPYIALVLLVIVGGKMLFDGINHSKKSEKEADGVNNEESVEKTSVKPLTVTALLVQAVATSVDALSTGFSLADAEIAGNIWWRALISVAIIAVITFGISLGGVFVGKKVGDKLGHKAEILGGIILICIGVEIFVSGLFL